MRKFRAIISMLLAFVLVVSVFAIAVVSTGVVSAASAAPSLSLSNKYNGIRGKWTAVSGASHYIVYFRRASETQWSSDIAYSNYYPLLDTGYLFMELTPGVNYSFQLRALNGLSNPFSAVSKITYVPQFQTEVSLSNQTSSRSILAEWAPVTGATQYTVYFKSASSASWRSVTTDENEIVLTNANQGTLYSVQVRPLFSGTPGLYSKVASIVYTAVTDEKPVVTAANSDDGINVSWTRVSGASSYILYYKLTGEAEWQSFETEDNEILVTQPVGGSQYSFQVQPVFGTTPGAYSRVVSIVYRTDKAPVLSLSVSNGWITLSWTDVAGVGSYRVEYWNSSDPSKVSSREIGDRSAVLKGVTKGVTYYFRVTPLFAGQAGTASEVQSIMLF
ncbi:MAG: fibronectin type III domain-containing protein [Ruminococcus sp.]|nr:fibronectin type III domain-containing protein [Ruminococcus sp.]